MGIGIFSVTFLLALALACVSAPAEGKPLRFTLVPKESHILAKTPHPFGTIEGKFTLRSGEASGDIQDLRRTGLVKVTIDADSYKSNVGLRDQDVQENYLEVDRYPMIPFTSTAVEDVKQMRPPATGWEFTVKGVLELHGVKREVRIPVKLTQLDKKIIIEGSTRILLKDYNIAVPTLLFIRAGEATEVSFQFVGKRQP